MCVVCGVVCVNVLSVLWLLVFECVVVVLVCVVWWW